MFQNRPVWFMRDNGVLLSSVKDWDKEIESLTTELTEQERQSRFAKYYLRPLRMPSHNNLKAVEVGNPLQQEDMFMPEEMTGRLQSVQNLKYGYGVMENGIGFSISHVLMEGVTAEKTFYFIKNFIPEGDLFYKCWFPGTHLRHYADGCVEDVGLGTELVKFLCGIEPEEWPGEIKDPLAYCIMGGAGVSWPLHDLFKKDRYCMYCHYFRDLPDHSGKESISMFWHGLTWKDRKSVRMIPEDQKVSVDRVRSQMNHAVWEFSQIPQILNMFYECGR